MAKKKKAELEDDFNLVITMWGEGTFSSMIKNGNAEVAHFADNYWDNLTQAGMKDALTKIAFFKMLMLMPELSAEDRCRVALNTAMRLRATGFRPVGTRKDILDLAERLWKPADQPLRDACGAALNDDVYACADFASGYGPNHILSARRILSAWMVQK
jgi:hypothetical protein